MTKYRIKEEWYSAHGKHYVVYSRMFMFVWARERAFDTLKSAQYHIATLKEDAEKPKDRVIYEE